MEGLEWFYLIREKGIQYYELLSSNSIVFFCSSSYFAVVVSISFTGQVKMTLNIRILK